MELFLIENGVEYSYSRLLKDVNSLSYYYPSMRSNDLYELFLNLIVAIVSGNPITMVDSDINDFEIEKLGVGKVNKSYPIDQLYFKDKFELIDCIRKSNSEISLFTSGTTGQPKKVVHFLSSLTKSVRISDRHANQKWAFAYNPTHMAGLQVFFQAFLNGNTIINVFNYARENVYQLIKTYSVTHISATPTFYRLLLPVETTFCSVERVTLGGEKSENKLHDKITQIFPIAKINNIYASTEAGALFSTKGEFFHIPLELLDKVKVVDDELLIHKSLVGQSDNFLFTDDFYHTGDLIEWKCEEQRLFRFKSRKNELINVGGYKVNPTEVENTISQISIVEQVKVFGKKNSVLGNLLCAEVKIAGDQILTESQIRNFLSDKLQDYKIPRKIKFVNSFELTRTGKIKRI